METTRRIALLELGLARQLGWIAAADAKTAFIFGVVTAMLGVLASAAPKYGRWTAAGVIFAIISATLLLGSLASVLVGVFPRTRGPKLSVIFFGGIGSRTVDEFRTDIQSLSDDAYEEDLIEQCHINATIAGIKYRAAKVAAVFLAAGVLPWVVATYVLFRDR